MIIAIDESGDFRMNTRALFLGVLIRPSERDEIVEAYRDWERRVRRDLGLVNELKGHSVTDRWARVLFRDVLAPAGRHPVRYFAFGVDVDQANLAGMDAQRQFSLEDYGRWATELESLGRPDRARWVNQHAHWFKARSGVHILKLLMLGLVITQLIEHALPVAILGGFDEELEHMRVFVDRGYVKKDDLDRWREVLRNVMIVETLDRPLPVLDSWTDEHPFLRKFIEPREGDGPVALTPAFREAIDFHDSTRTPEVRIADVIGSLVYRATIKGEQLPSYGRIRALSLDPHPYTLIGWTTNRRPPTENPYDSLRT